MNLLIFDVRKYIATFDAVAWLRLFMIDDEFKNYAVSREGIDTFIKMFTYIDNNGSTRLRLFECLHSVNDQHALINAFGDKCWYFMGKLHRDNDKPAMVTKNDDKYWYKMGKLHRENDQPAAIEVDCDVQEWFIDGRLHRENDMPARVSDYCLDWYYNGSLHRENNKPAIVYEDGDKYWWLNGVQYYPKIDK